MQKTTLTNLSIVAIILLGTLPFLQLLWNHPFIGGTPDVLVFTGFATSSLQAQAIDAKANHGFFTALQLFPFTFLQGVIMNLANTLNPLLNFWILQHIMNFVSTGLFFILGRNPVLSRAELLSYLETREIKWKEHLFKKNFLALELEEEFDFKIHELGGLMKLGKILFRGKLQEFGEFLDEQELTEKNKLSY